jgi:prevent-host-death family protein
MEVSVREMKNNLSKYLKRAKAGEEVIITVRGRPVARLGPAAVRETISLDEPLARLGNSPLVRPGKGGKPKGARRPIAWKPGNKRLSDLLREDRD